MGDVSNLSPKDKQKQDALALAEVIYSVFKEKKQKRIVINGQNNAKSTTS